MAAILFTVSDSFDARMIASTHAYQRLAERRVNVLKVRSMIEENFDILDEEVDSGFDVMLRSERFNISVCFSVAYNEKDDVLELSLITAINDIAFIPRSKEEYTHVYDI